MITHNIITLIPARRDSTRLPRKPLAQIGDKPMIVHSVERAKIAGCGSVFVATDDEEIAAIVQEHGHQSILTRQDHQSGSDRIFEALQFIDPAQTFNIVINLQGDLPFIEAEHLRQVVRPLLAFPSVDIATLCSPINTIEQVKDPNIVKLIGSPCPKQPNILSALYFTRAQAPYGAGPFFEHIGVYAYQRQALQRFVHFPPSALEQREKLEQLRALENGMTIKATLVENCPISVDTAGDLEKARLFWHAQQKHTSCS